ncbi:MAG: hypothetical protein R3321_01345 [Nitrososphaeraceae archaeon]|nr:hypothetical protein [Nitrososphaeraceae archaeon]
MKREVMFLFGVGFKDWFIAVFRRKIVSAFIKDETIIQVGNQHFW